MAENVMSSSDPDSRPPDGLSRRDFLKGLGVASGAGMLQGLVTTPADAQDAASDTGVRRIPASGVTMRLTINGVDKEVHVRPSDTLLHTLRETLGLTGSKEVCDRGACGACTVLVDGRSVNSCLMLTVDAVGTRITTVEGLSKDGRLHPVQQSFARHDACQCGYCIPGFVVRSTALLQEFPSPSDDQIRKGLSGNICRCGTYPKIVDAVRDAAGGGSA
jgi:aerobic-type carbon monoxide dehydrogenase small subunit (CoxS/CutS family)